MTASIERPSPAPPSKKKSKTISQKKWRPQKLFPRLAPRMISRRKRFSSTSFQRQPPMMMEAGEEESNDAFEAELKDPDTAPPGCDAATTSSPPRTGVRVDKQCSGDNMKECCTTPRPLAELNPFLDDEGASVTPPVSCPAPLIVSSKRLSKEVRRNHSSKRRRGRFSCDGKENGGCAAMTEWREGSWSSLEEEEEEEESDDLPPSMDLLSPEERAKQYWQWCYGSKNQPQQASWSASRKPPAKSCLSSTKRARTEPPDLHCSPDARLPHQSETVAFRTPSSSMEDDDFERIHPSSHTKSIQFGTASAMEFETDQPATALTPLPSEVAQERFPLDFKQPSEDEVEQTEETKRNSAILADWDTMMDSDEDEQEGDLCGEELETMLFSRKRKSGRRSSGFFSPSEGSTSLLDDDIESEINHMATLAVQSPAKVKTPVEEGSEMGAVSQVESNDVAASTMESPEQEAICSNNQVRSPAEVSSSDIEDTTPPSNVRLGSVNSTGGALLVEENASSPMELPTDVRQLHGALEKCADDNKVDILDMILKDPRKEDCNWELATLLFNMARQRTVTRQNMVVFSPQLRNCEFLSALTFAESCLPIPTVKAVQGVIFKKMEGSVVNTNTATGVPKEIGRDLLEVIRDAACFEWNKMELESMRLVRDELEACGKQIVVESTKLQNVSEIKLPGKSPRYHSQLQQRLCDEEMAIKRLEDAVAQEKSNYGIMNARASIEQAEQEIERALPFSYLGFCTLSGVVTFQLCTVSEDTIEVSFRGAVNEYRTHIQFSVAPKTGLAENVEGFVKTTVMNLSNLAPGDTSTVPMDDIAAFFHQTLLCGGSVIHNGGPLGSACTVPVASSILKRVTSNAEEMILDISSVLGRLDLAALDLMRVKQRFPDNCEIMIEYDDEQDTVVLTIALLSNKQRVNIQLYYQRQDDKCVLFSIPSRVQVLNAQDQVLEKLQHAATVAIDSLSLVNASASFVETTCTAVNEAVLGSGLQ